MAKRFNYRYFVETAPLPNRKVYDLMDKYCGGKIVDFATFLGLLDANGKPQDVKLGRIFLPDPRNKTRVKYPDVSQEIKEAIMDKLGFDESWFYVDESPSAVVNQQGSRNAVSSIGDSNTINISDVSDQDLKIEILQERYDEAMRYVKKLEADNIVLQETNKRLLDMLERALSGATSSVQSKAQ